MELGVPCAPYRSSSYSPWRGCTRLIVEAFDESYSRNEASLQLEDFIERVLSRFAS